MKLECCYYMYIFAKTFSVLLKTNSTGLHKDKVLHVVYIDIHVHVHQPQALRKIAT